MHDKAIFKAFKIFGTQQVLADNLGLTQVSVSHWLNRAHKIPFKQALKIDFYTGSLVDVTELTSEEPEMICLWKNGMLLKGVPFMLMPIGEIIKGNKQCPIYKDTPNICSHIIDPLEFYRPILTDSNNHLITCECRLRAHLERKNKKVRVYCLDVKILQNNLNFSSFAKYYPLNERVDIGIWVEKMLADRQGNRTDLELVDHYPQVVAGKKTRDIAASIAGFGSDFSYRQAKKIIQLGTSELIKAANAETISISKAHELAQLSLQEQLHSLTKINNSKNKKGN